VLLAAKEEMFSGVGPWCAHLPLPADPQLAENSRQGFQVLDSTLHLGLREVKSSTTLGMRRALYDTGIRSRCTGKERDAETGLDEFPKRYYGNALGRWMTPDPLPWIDWQHGNREEREHFEEFISNPQNFNMYAYVDNNPESRDDPTGMEGCQAGDKKFSTCTIKVVYDKKTSNGTLTVTGQNKGDKKPTVLLTTSVVVGGDGHVTPTGTFTATVWEKDHVSTKYGNAANTPWSKTKLGGNAFGPYQLHMKELDSRGIFIHGTMGPSWSPTTWGNSIFLSPASHGCVRMCNSDNIKLHDMMPNPSGNKVIITQQPEE